VPPIFALLQRHGDLPDAEMFRVYNMSVGFCVVVDPMDAARVEQIAAQLGKAAAVVDYAVDDAQRRVWIPPRGLVDKDDTFIASRDKVPSPPGRGTG